ncbi:heavy-metal-associated domain-containing protein [Phytohabitans suffuscus]|nr:heavy-metal-associated domain-containing protein [Phytohabitans suffuscus]
MTTAFTAMDVVSIVENLPGVHRAQASVPAGRVVVDADPAGIDPHTLAAVLTTAGYPSLLEQP